MHCSKKLLAVFARYFCFASSEKLICLSYGVFRPHALAAVPSFLVDASDSRCKRFGVLHHRGMSDEADSSLSASQLRQRYLKGGTARDDELSAAQLRARHGIAANPREFSTSQWRRSVLASPLALAAFVAAVVAAFAGALYFVLAGR